MVHYLITNSVHILQTGLSSVAAYYAYQSITKTQTYEKQTEKAAKYSNTAEYHLWKTRKTLGGAAVGIFASLMCSATFLLEEDLSEAVGSVTSFGLACFLTLSHNHVSNYWKSSPKVPLPKMGDYNDAIYTTEAMRLCLMGLAGAWAVSGGLYLWEALVE